MFTDPARHQEIRDAVIDYMRANRQDFQQCATTEDIQSRRPTRAKIRAAKEQNINDPFGEYLARMEISGTYGGELELVAFCKAFDRDVIIHRTQGSYEAESRFSNPNRSAEAPVIVLHVAYEAQSAEGHYDSVHDSVRDSDTTRRSAATRKTGAMASKGRRAHAQPAQRSSNNADQTELITGAMPRWPPSGMQQFSTKGMKHLDENYRRLVNKDRDRSSSASSSQRSSSSKRSLGPDHDSQRAAKRADRRKSYKRKDVAVIASADSYTRVPFSIRLDSQEPSTPASTQDTEYSSDPKEGTRASVEEEYNFIDDGDDSSYSDGPVRRAVTGNKSQTSKSQGRKGVAIITKKSLS